MLPLYDAGLDASNYNILQPLKEILPYDLPKCSSEQPAATNKQPEKDGYCKACKKKFNNETTYQNHLKSAKHIANQKKTVQKTATQPKIPVHPQVQEALQQLQVADTSKDPTVAIQIYWTQAQILYQLKRPQHTERALSSLIGLLSSQPAGLTLTSAQVTYYLYNSQLALARLYCLYQQLEKAWSFYLDGLNTKWKIDRVELLKLAQEIRFCSLDQLLTSCDTLATKYLTRERNRTKPAPVLSDRNNAFSIILNEAGNLFAQQDQLFMQVPVEHIAIVFYGLGSLVCSFEPSIGFSSNDFYFILSNVYHSLGWLHRVIDVKLLDRQDTWHVLDAFLMSLEIDDLVRARAVEAYFKESIYPDVQLVCQLCQAKCTLQSVPTLSFQLDHISLLLEQTTEPLLIRTQSKQDQAQFLARVRDLIS
ncbi:hypothetical protein A0J61_01465 [Choanephora cucurbitarum]|uniref:C2H2-type domain-containing protein n=1 Tax=Choanephora cucurbitarum TaxID=101091 RepID=A0A1C7NN27_9FUNG|nr:hypothetical protein A0J61_01465 [Choanephora cucurbitarum]